MNGQTILKSGSRHFKEYKESRIVAKAKRVHFNENIEEINYFLDDDESMCMRRCYWEIFARDRYRFMDRIRRVEEELISILGSNHRENIYRNRFHSTMES